MNDRYKQAKEIFLRVCDLSSAERKAILDRECAGNAELRAEVESLIVHHHLADHDPAEAATSAPSSKSSAGHPMRIGPYRVHHEIGRGGMGVVYVAVRDDDQFKRRVALKVLKRGMDTDDVLRRFELERQLLAAMNHPNIARLYDGGQTDDGRPYFVMEYVEGLPLDEYCDVHRLHIDERLELFRTVCAAVHYAHQNLVVHRDLKPGNILVSKDGVPKLLDFGIAKLINPEFAFIHGDPTAPEFRVMTPEYASPEQVRGNPITTASDVYSLGVILYELVSGHRPYHIKSRVRAELERIICDEEPDRPSTAISKIEQVGDERPGKPASTRTVTPESVSRTRESGPNRLRRRIAGDIDNIVLMAMRKEPQRRYKSAEQLAEDLRRHLTGLTVIARKDTLGYRSLKFINRNRGPVAVAAVIVLLLVGGMISTAWQARQTEKQRIIAETERASAIQARDALDEFTMSQMQVVGDFADRIEERIRPLIGNTAARETILTAAEWMFSALLVRTGDAPELAKYRALILERRGSLLGSNRMGNLGDVEGGISSLREAMAIRQSLADQNPESFDAQRNLAMCKQQLADLLVLAGRTDEALLKYEQALTTFRTLVSLENTVPANQRGVTVNLLKIADIQFERGAHNAALELFEECRVIRDKAVQASPDDPTALRDWTVLVGRIASVHVEQGRIVQAVEQYRALLATRNRINDLEKSGRSKRDLAISHFFLGNALYDDHQYQAALEQFTAGRTLTRELLDADPVDDRARRDVCLLEESVGRSLNSLLNFDEALACHQNALRIGEALLAKENTNQTYRQTAAAQHYYIGCILVQLGEHDEARPHLQESIDMFEELLARSPQNQTLKSLLAQAESCRERLTLAAQ
jgi:serine/threonine protein kinase/tetratricopeptide (TPR) repeat protein